MLDTDHLLSARRRALNMVWTAAGEYDFEPVFLAFSHDSVPDFYLNSIIGYVHKWYDQSVMQALYDQIEEALLKETLDGLLWIGLENCAFLKELSERPVLAEMRTECARQFFRQQLSRSRQQWMAQNSLVYALQAARWRTVLGKDPGLVNPWERKLFEELAFPAEWDAVRICAHATDIFRRYFRFGTPFRPFPSFQGIRHRINTLARKALPHRFIRAEDLSFSRDGSGRGILTPKRPVYSGPISAIREEQNRIYIESCFGPPLLGYKENQELESRFCTGHHQDCHLYYASGNYSPQHVKDALARHTIKGAQIQAERNRTHYQDKVHFYRNNITQLSEQIRNALLVYPQPSPVQNRTGTLAPSRIWRAVHLNDDRIFTDTFHEEQPDFSVDLMLDASASRLQSQEIVAAQAYVIAKSLRICRIPVQVFSFLSLRGYTVLRQLCGYEDPHGEENIFDYFASGWNRDGLAIRAARRLMEDSPAKNRLLIILTDASPNDDRRMTPEKQENTLWRRAYSDEAGVEDTASEVRTLVASGFHVMAVLTSDDGETTAARKIYGDQFVRIENIRKLSDGVGSLLQKQIEKMRS